MGISIEQYRSRIGKYLPNIQWKVQRNLTSKSSSKVPNQLVPLVVAVALAFVLCSTIRPKSQANFKKAPQFGCSLVYPISYQQVSYYSELSNFTARYIYGNRSSRQSNGLKIAHLNKGSGFLVTKMSDIENAISNLKPHLLGVSEANLYQNHDVSAVQLSDYSLLKCPTIFNADLGYSRVVVYVHKSTVYKVRDDLMSND